MIEKGSLQEFFENKHFPAAVLVEADNAKSHDIMRASPSSSYSSLPKDSKHKDTPPVPTIRMRLDNSMSSSPCNTLDSSRNDQFPLVVDTKFSKDSTTRSFGLLSLQQRTISSTLSTIRKRKESMYISTIGSNNQNRGDYPPPPSRSNLSRSNSVPTPMGRTPPPAPALGDDCLSSSLREETLPAQICAARRWGSSASVGEIMPMTPTRRSSMEKLDLNHLVKSFLQSGYPEDDDSDTDEDPYTSQGDRYQKNETSS